MVSLPTDWNIYMWTALAIKATVIRQIREQFFGWVPLLQDVTGIPESICWSVWSHLPCFRYSSCWYMIFLFLQPSPVSLSHPVTLPSSCISEASPFPPPRMVLSSCFWSLASLLLCMAQISTGQQLKWPFVTAKSLDTIWETKLLICSLTWRRCFVVEMLEFSSTDKNQKTRPKHFY